MLSFALFNRMDLNKLCVWVCSFFLLDMKLVQMHTWEKPLQPSSIKQIIIAWFDSIFFAEQKKMVFQEKKPHSFWYVSLKNVYAFNQIHGNNAYTALIKTSFSLALFSLTRLFFFVTIGRARTCTSVDKFKLCNTYRKCKTFC